MRKKVKFFNGGFVNDGEVNVPTYEEKFVGNRAYTVYRGLREVSKGLRALEFELLLFLLEEMDMNNYIRGDRHTREQFIDDSGYSDAVVRRSFKVLIGKNVMKRISKGVYKMNPEFFWKKENDRDRGKKISEYLES